MPVAGCGARCGVEIITFDQNDFVLPVEPDNGGSGFAFPAMIFPDAENAAASGIETEICISAARCAGHGGDAAIGMIERDSPGLAIAENDFLAGRHPIGAATIFMDICADLVIDGEQIPWRFAAFEADKGRAPPFLRSAFEPV